MDIVQKEEDEVEAVWILVGLVLQKPSVETRLLAMMTVFFEIFVP